MIIFLMLIPLISYAGFSEVDNSDLYNYKEKKTYSRINSKKSKRAKSKNVELELKKITAELLEKEKSITVLLEKSQKSLIVKSSEEKVLALTRLRGTILNSVVAMNVKPSKFIVRLLSDNEELEGGELKCLGYSFQKRVSSHCNQLILDGTEYSVKIDLWDLDGAEGVIANYYYSGEEKSFLTSSFASFLDGVLSAAKETISTPYGQVSKTDSKNKILGGLSGIADNANKKIVQSGEKEIEVSFINSGKEVIVFFDQTLNLGELK